MRCCFKFQEISDQNNDGIHAIVGLFVYLSDFLLQNFMNVLLAYYLHSHHFFSLPSKAALYFFSALYYLLSFVPPCIGI